MARLAYLRSAGAGATIVAVVLSLAALTPAATAAVKPGLGVAVAGQGSVSSANGRLSCPGTCALRYARGTVVTLTAAPADQWGFGGWSGACTGAAPTCTVVVQSAAGVQATFVALTGIVDLTVGGPGAISSTPAGLSCGTNGAGPLTSCMGTFAQGTTVSLSPTAAGTGSFAAWGGGCAGTDATASCSVSVGSTPAYVSATFAHATAGEGRQTLTATETDPEPAVLQSDPSGVTCDNDLPLICGGQFDSGTLVTLTGGVAWSGDCVGIMAPCVVDLDSTTTLAWDPPPASNPPQYGVNVTVSGPGQVTIGATKPLICNRVSGLPGCQTLVAQGTTVQLTAMPTGGKARLARWGGACTGTKKSCSVLVAASVNVGASFATAAK